MAYSANEQELTRLACRQAHVLVNRLSGLVGLFEPKWPTSLLLADGGAIDSVAVWRDIIDADGHDIAAAQSAIDDEGKVALLALDRQFRLIDQTGLGRSGGFAVRWFPLFHEHGAPPELARARPLRPATV